MANYDHYSFLGLTKDCNSIQIKQAFKRLALRWHPDKNPDNPQADKIFARIFEAYNVLRDPMKKLLYDENQINETVDILRARTRVSDLCMSFIKNPDHQPEKLYETYGFSKDYRMQIMKKFYDLINNDDENIEIGSHQVENNNQNNIFISSDDNLQKQVKESYDKLFKKSNGPDKSYIRIPLKSKQSQINIIQMKKSSPKSPNPNSTTMMNHHHPSYHTHNPNNNPNIQYDYHHYYHLYPHHHLGSLGGHFGGGLGGGGSILHPYYSNDHIANLKQAKLLPRTKIIHKGYIKRNKAQMKI